MSRWKSVRASCGQGSGPPRESSTWSVDASSTASGDENYGHLAGYLTQGRSYTLYARALDLAGNETSSAAAVSFTWSGPTGNVPPPAPAWITAQVLGTSSITWTWALVDGATGYTVYASSTGPWLAAVTTNTVTVTGLTPNTGRRRCVAAVGALGESPILCAVGVTFAAAPSQLQAVSVSSYSITWAWDASGNPAGTYYALGLSTDGFQTNFSTPVPFSMLFTSTSTTVFGLAPGTLYYAGVRAANAVFAVTGHSNLASTQTLAGLPGLALSPAIGPIGMPFSITGTGFGAYDGANTRVKFGLASAPLSVWNDTTISGTVPSRQ